MNKYFSIMLFSFFTLAGCGSPAADDVGVEVKVQDDLSVRPVRVTYQSSRCWSLNFTASGKPYRKGDFKVVDVALERRGDSNVYEANIAVNGGGVCQWRLIDLTLGVVYKSNSTLAAGVERGAEGEVMVVFYDHDEMGDSPDTTADADLRIKIDYYPWVVETYLGGYKKYMKLFGGGGRTAFNSSRVKTIYFEPALHSRYWVYSTGPKEKREGNSTVFTYPDGSHVQDGRVDPDFYKLQCIRLPTECE